MRSHWNWQSFCLRWRFWSTATSDGPVFVCTENVNVSWQLIAYYDFASNDNIRRLHEPLQFEKRQIVVSAHDEGDPCFQFSKTQLHICGCVWQFPSVDSLENNRHSECPVWKPELAYNDPKREMHFNWMRITNCDEWMNGINFIDSISQSQANNNPISHSPFRQKQISAIIYQIIILQCAPASRVCVRLQPVYTMPVRPCVLCCFQFSISVRTTMQF